MSPHSNHGNNQQQLYLASFRRLRFPLRRLLPSVMGLLFYLQLPLV